MTGFDWIVLALIPVMAYAGHRLGFLVSTLSFGGFVVGVLVGLAAAPYLLADLAPSPERALLAFGIVLAMGVLCQAAGSFIGGTAREALPGTKTVRADAALGALMAVLALLAGSWLIGGAASRAGDLPFAAAARESRVVAAIGWSVPLDSDALLASFATLVDRSGFPAVFSDLGLEVIPPIEAPDPAVLDKPGVRAAAGSLVKVIGAAPSCARRVEGSGFVVSPHRVMTNAHVVAGTDSLDVYLAGSVEPYSATVVYFDPDADIAVLAVPDLDAPALPIGDSLSRGDAAVVAGFPGDGPLKATPARVRGEVVALGEDIYGQAAVERSVYSLRTQVRAGNSGGPLLDSSGAAVGLVFAASIDDPGTGYALTPEEFRPAAVTGKAARNPVSTGACTP